MCLMYSVLGSLILINWSPSLSYVDPENSERKTVDVVNGRYPLSVRTPKEVMGAGAKSTKWYDPFKNGQWYEMEDYIAFKIKKLSMNSKHWKSIRNHPTSIHTHM